jgi:hypothetical protein
MDLPIPEEPPVMRMTFGMAGFKKSKIVIRELLVLFKINYICETNATTLVQLGLI